jgi:hypothetical protein
VESPTDPGVQLRTHSDEFDPVMMLGAFVCCNGVLASLQLGFCSNGSCNIFLRSGARRDKPQVLNGRKRVQCAKRTSDVLAPMGLKAKTPVPNCRVEFAFGP